MRRLATVLCATLLAAVAAVAAPSGARFTLTEARTQAVSGPFTFLDGARVRVSGVLYTLSIADDGRITFTARGGAKYGPYQPVDGRLMKIGDAMYSYNGGTSSLNSDGGAAPSQRGLGRGAPAAPIATFDPLPPKPEPIEIPPETAQRTAPALDLPALPDPTRPFAWHLWFAPVDRTPLKWKVESVNGSKADFERETIGTGLSINSWRLDAAYSMSGKSGAIVPSGLGISGASIDDASGFSLALGYKRPFLREGPWTASAGILGCIRQEKGDISSTALVSTGEADTNNVGNVLSSYKKRTSSVKITEKTLRLDFDLGYRYEDFYGYAGLIIQPLSAVDVSGDLPYGDDKLSIDAEHNEAVGVVFGGSVDLIGNFCLYTDLTLITETRFRIGLSREW